MEIGKKRKKKGGGGIEVVAVLPSITKAAWISRTIYLRGPPSMPVSCVELRSAGCGPDEAVREATSASEGSFLFFPKSKRDSTPLSCVTYLIYMFHIYSVSQQWQSRTQSSVQSGSPNSLHDPAAATSDTDLERHA